MKNEKKLIIVGIIVLLVVLTIIGIVVFKKDKQVNNMNKNTLQILDFEIKNRKVITKDNEIIVGNNEKEIQNGYYDLKITNNGTGVNIYLNKLWYEKYNDDYIQEDYLAQIVREIIRQLKIEENKEDIEYELYKYLFNNYLKAKEGEGIAPL